MTTILLAPNYAAVTSSLVLALAILAALVVGTYIQIRGKR